MPPLLLLNINKKTYMSLMAASYLIFSDVERSKSASPNFEALYLFCIYKHLFIYRGLALYLVKGLNYLVPVLLVCINSKAYLGSPMAPSDLTLKARSQGHLHFEGPYPLQESS